MQIKNKQLAGFRTITSSYVMTYSEDVLVSAGGINVVLPPALDGDFFTAVKEGSWSGITTYIPASGFTVNGLTTPLELSDSIQECKFILNGTDWVTRYISNDHSLLDNLSEDDHPQYLNEARADAIYQRITFETVSKNLDASSAVATELPSGLLDNITYANGIVKTFSWDSGDRLQSVTLSGNVPLGIPLTKNFVWTSSGFTFNYS